MFYSWHFTKVKLFYFEESGLGKEKNPYWVLFSLVAFYSICGYEMHTFGHFLL